MIVDATKMFCRRIAQNCLDLWTRDQTIAAVQRIGEEHEAEIVRQIELLQQERLSKRT